MIGHRLKSILFIEIDGGRLRIHHEANAADLAGNTHYAVNGVEKHVLANAFSLMPFSACQSTQSKYGHFGR